MHRFLTVKYISLQFCQRQFQVTEPVGIFSQCSSVCQVYITFQVEETLKFMFHTLITLSYAIPGLYLFFRILNLFIEKRHYILYFIIYAVLFSIYPLSSILENKAGKVALIIGSVSNYLLPFFLYLFLSLLFTDLLLLLNLVFKIAPFERIKRRNFRTWWFAGILSLSVLIVIAGTINFNTIRITGYSITVPAGSSRCNQIRIAFVSDTHLEEKVPVGFVRKFAEKVNSLKPDLLLLGGDIVEGGRMGARMENFEMILSGIKTTYGVYGVLGNHDGYGRGNVEEFLKRSGIVVLKDSVLIRDSAFILAGRLDSRVQDRKSPMELLNGIHSDLPVILLDHRPTDYAGISKTGADLVLSGHTHNGQLFPINLITGSVYELSYGYIKRGNINFIVSSGLRLWGPPVRTTAKSEIVIIDLLLR
jgi:uncharacterized protein